MRAETSGGQIMTLNLSMPGNEELKPRITVIGVGGAGGNAVNNMIEKKLEGCEFVVANTDAPGAAAEPKAATSIQLGVKVTEGARRRRAAEVGAAAAEESIEEIVDHLVGCHMCFITAGMGGGTGTGAPRSSRRRRANGHPDRRRRDQALPVRRRQAGCVRPRAASRRCRSTSTP
jgi:cell division GTPase FtsZ